ncbi:hypothetical protein BRADI_5g05642v3 [Brachypodium distachyon]|uniref:Uncharacterized protein n=1 Tax=Brachypodium distachyon TaxID=15368 RepID=A0A0Q3H1Y2_BRADI|nr:hypothetical protein BRADI_5g05642v3 [Brachypodium distachyon]
MPPDDPPPSANPTPILNPPPEKQHHDPNLTSNQNQTRPMPSRNISRSWAEIEDEEEARRSARQRAQIARREREMQRAAEVEERARFEEEQREREADVPDLALDLQALKISAPVACSGGTPRNISKHAVSVAMAKAWGKNYQLIAEVAPNLFMAQFLSVEAMHFVIAKQPWTMGSDNLLIEWVNPNEDSKSNEDYKFDTLYVPIRIYGVPMSLRSLSLLQGILKKVGEPSDLHPLTESMLFAKGTYIYGIAKMNIHKPVKDRVKLTVSESTNITAYIHYEKIGRICTFCGIMFHTVFHCRKRIDLFMERIAKKQSSADLPFERNGKWMTIVEEIPKETKLEYEVQEKCHAKKIQKTFQSRDRV